MLTKRELEVLMLVARACPTARSRRRSCSGEGTVKYHVKNILRKLQARSRTEAVATLHARDEGAGAHVTCQTPPALARAARSARAVPRRPAGTGRRDVAR